MRDSASRDIENTTALMNGEGTVMVALVYRDYIFHSLGICQMRANPVLEYYTEREYTGALKTAAIMHNMLN
ncbi:hypothetical protein SERLADRAFT_394688 [Serpula lacrymans var. lacrymans S7.9]|nr:uncharacterized protein SERLADRAFT_394688 [Serpula lacrymans var. lacrymans S7.9]EGO22071.1 hypothetical protein SERLADRAFT_394688 [Serpula lacrymans var. lacrymans S7.9]